MNSAAPPFWNRETYAARRQGLLVRARLKAAIRAHFDAAGFLEVETGWFRCRRAMKTHLHAFAAQWLAPGDVPQQGYLTPRPNSR